MGTLSQDFRYGLRMLRKNPGFTAVTVITLALAIGANTAIFSVVYPVLLRPLPFRDPQRLVTIGESRHRTGCCAYSASYPDFLDWRRTTKSFQSLGGFTYDAFTLSGNGEPKTMFCAMVTTNFFATLGVSPILGRDFAAGEDLPEGQGPTVALLSYNFWRRDFSADPGIVGRSSAPRRQACHCDWRSSPQLRIRPGRRCADLGAASLEQLRNHGARRPLAERHSAARTRRDLGAVPRRDGSHQRAAGCRVSARERARHRQRRAAALRDRWQHSPAAAGAVWRGVFRLADRLRQHRQPDDEPLHRSPAGVCRARRAGSQADSSGLAIADRKLAALHRRRYRRISGSGDRRVAVGAVRSRSAADGDAVSGGCWHQLSGDGLYRRDHRSDRHSLRPWAGTFRPPDSDHRSAEGRIARRHQRLCAHACEMCWSSAKSPFHWSCSWPAD